MLSPERRRTATVQALAPTATLSLSFAEFEVLRATHPSVERLLVILLAARVQRLTEGLMEALHVSAEARMARRVLDLTESHTTAATTAAPRQPPRQPGPAAPSSSRRRSWRSSPG